ncbi:RING Zn-finger domain-containing protein [Ordospora colligata]|uniref:RING Zn-finger domain-containing protein n=1 Tax=Ordospora colligata OC4 TaxID=1354746 RepID=A0A0B2UMB6_9MICR|nr:RING Zn-finger domain-containing protein [Ordospora colligata OC4]KHN70414.1 RING Zn-finger domain-containing protein [Ordospora colligata OC4]TBU17164.1 RING Zn-finger domain-containing protein [Ordospora colligata]TBU17414.1 RING Zn-finger domain-containing protein [Ordospora colligata]TBU19594.1 RING Zn-finger domain-containing protein [Ordospora colligata]
MDCQICDCHSEIYASYDCCHCICIRCSLRLVVLYKQHNCPLCKTTTKTLRFNTSEAINKSETHKPLKEIKTSITIVYESNAVKKHVEDLLSSKCQKCLKTCSTLAQLRKHYSEHGLVLCSECIYGRKDFWDEFKLYKSSTIKDHRNGMLGEEGFIGHVFCVHCKSYLYDADNARQHCNIEHEMCQICDMVGLKYKYYRNFKDLESHYRNAHYCCMFDQCLANKCYAFTYQTELLAHLTKIHKLDVTLSSIPKKGDCDMPVMDPFKKRNVKCKVDILAPNGMIVDTRQSDNKHTMSIPNSPSLNVPTYLNRSILDDHKKSRARRKSVIDYFCTTDANEIECIIDEFMATFMTVTDAFNKVSYYVGDAQALKIFESVRFDHRQKDVSESIKSIRKKVMFPKFVPFGSPTYTEPERKQAPGFSVIDISKGKKL